MACRAPPFHQPLSVCCCLPPSGHWAASILSPPPRPAPPHHQPCRRWSSATGASPACGGGCRRTGPGSGAPCTAPLPWRWSAPTPSTSSTWSSMWEVRQGLAGRLAGWLASGKIGGFREWQGGCGGIIRQAHLGPVVDSRRLCACLPLCSPTVALCHSVRRGPRHAVSEVQGTSVSAHAKQSMHACALLSRQTVDCLSRLSKVYHPNRCAGPRATPAATPQLPALHLYLQWRPQCSHPVLTRGGLPIRQVRAGAGWAVSRRGEEGRPLGGHGQAPLLARSGHLPHLLSTTSDPSACVLLHRPKHSTLHPATCHQAPPSPSQLTTLSPFASLRAGTASSRPWTASSPPPTLSRR